MYIYDSLETYYWVYQQSEIIDFLNNFSLCLHSVIKYKCINLSLFKDIESKSTELVIDISSNKLTLEEKFDIEDKIFQVFNEYTWFNNVLHKIIIRMI